MIPLLHDFSDATVLIFGGGTVGARRARRFSHEARSIVVSPTFCEDDFGGAELVRAAPSPAEIPDWLDRIQPSLVVVATNDPAVNDAIATETRDRAILLNRADRRDDREVGNVAVPSTIRDDPVVVSVSTGGTSPTLSRYLRRRIEPEIAGAGDMAVLTAALVEELSEEGISASDRREIVRDVVNSSAVWKALRTGNPNPREAIKDVIESNR